MLNSGAVWVKSNGVQASRNRGAEAMQPDEIMVFGGSGSRKLVGRICEYLGVPVRASEVLRFSEGNIFVRILENVRGRSVYLVQSTSFPARRASEQ